MAELAVIKDKWHNSITERVQTPDGTLFVHIIENENGRPIMIQVSGAKTGTSVAAWCDALCRAVNVSLQTGVDWMRFIDEFSSITSAKSLRLVKGATVRSGPEGLAIALMRYRDGKNAELIEKEGLEETDEDIEDDGPRWKIPPELR